MPFPSPMHESESEVAQSCLTLSDPMDCRPPGSSVHGIFQARVLEWGAIAFPKTPTVLLSGSVVSDSLRSHGLQPTRLRRPWDFPGKSTGVGCHCLLRDIINTPQNSLILVSFSIREGEGDGTPLQYCCLENPMDGGAWWAAVHGVAKSRT